MKKQCKRCGREFTAKRKDAQFCSPSCRARYWQEQKRVALAGTELKARLNVVHEIPATSNKGPQYKTILIKKANPEHQFLIGLIDKKEEECRVKQKEKQILIEKVEQVESCRDGTGLKEYAALGGFFGLCAPGNKLANGTIGAIIGIAARRLFEKSHENEILSNYRQLPLVKSKINEMNVSLTLLAKELSALRARLSLTPAVIQEEKEVEVEPLPNPVPDPPGEPEKAELNGSANVIKRKNPPVQSRNEPSHLGRIIPSTLLTEVSYSALDFQGEWKALLGQPSVTFLCVIYGMAGEGKSTFAIRWAHYLAENSGKVVYVSGEEGFAKTMNDKLTNNKAHSDNLYIADLRSYQDLLAEVESNVYNFIFIDSLDNMHIGPQELKEIRRVYSNSAIITISQSTKDGKMRGSYEIVHDSDIAVEVSQGIARTVKNRFLDKGRTYRIFDTDPGPKALPLPRNTVRG